MTLQIAWTGVVRSQQRPAVVPRFPTSQQARFMALQAIVNGARGLVFFGGHLTQVCTPADAKAGWNWTYWDRILRPLVVELSSDDVRPALVAPKAKATVKAGVERASRSRRARRDAPCGCWRRGGTEAPPPSASPACRASTTDRS